MSGTTRSRIALSVAHSGAHTHPKIRASDADVRSEIAGAFESGIRSLQFSGDGYKSGQVDPMHGIVYIPHVDRMKSVV